MLFRKLATTCQRKSFEFIADLMNESINICGIGKKKNWESPKKPKYYKLCKSDGGRGRGIFYFFACKSTEDIFPSAEQIKFKTESSRESNRTGDLYCIKLRQKCALLPHYAAKRRLSNG